MRRAVIQSTAPRPGILRWPTPRSKKWTFQFLKEASGSDNIRAIVAVGSAVRPGVPSADLDLVVICKDPENLRVRAPMEIDLRIHRADQVQQELAKGSDVLGWAVKYGCVLFQRHGHWDGVLADWRDKVPLPSAELAAQRAGKASNRLRKMIEVRDLDAAKEQALAHATQQARAELLRHKVYPASRPELPAQLRKIGAREMARRLSQLMNRARPGAGRRPRTGNDNVQVTTHPTEPGRRP